MKPTANILYVYLSSLNQNIDGFVFEHLPESAQKEYWEKVCRRHILTKMIEQGYESIDWKRGHKEGIFCENDYTMFNELKEQDPYGDWKD